MSSMIRRQKRFPNAKTENLASSFLNTNVMWSRNQQQLMFNTSMEILSRKNANRAYRNKAHDILYLLAKPWPEGGYGRLWQLNHPTHMHYRGFPNENWTSPPRRRPTPPRRRPSPPRRNANPPRSEYTLNTFSRAPSTRNTFNTYALAWFGVNFRGKPLNRKMAVHFWPNKHPGNNRATKLSQLFTKLKNQ